MDRKTAGVTGMRLLEFCAGTSVLIALGISLPKDEYDGASPVRGVVTRGLAVEVVEVEVEVGDDDEGMRKRFRCVTQVQLAQCHITSKAKTHTTTTNARSTTL